VLSHFPALQTFAVVRTQRTLNIVAKKSANVRFLPQVFISTSLNSFPGDNGPSAKPILPTITATQSGKTVTGIFALQTLTSYSSLRQAVTTTVIKTTTNPDGSTAVKTAAAVVFAGGVAWFLAGMLSLSLLPPPFNGMDD